MTGEQGNKFGKFIPAVGIHQSKGVLVSTALGEKLFATQKNRSVIPALKKWTHIEVSQSLQGKDYIYDVHIGGERVFSMKNTRPRDFYDVKVYAGSPLSPPLAGPIRNLKIEVAVEKFSSIEEGIY